MRISSIVGMMLVSAVVAGCDRRPEVPLHLQGTVTSIGYAKPVNGADVVIEWPASLGGGSTTVKTDSEGHYVAGRTVRVDRLDCKGLSITVRKEGFASAYNENSDDCSDGTISADFKLFPIPR